MSVTRPITIRKNPLITDVTLADLREQFDLAIAIRDKVSEANQAVTNIRDLKRQVTVVLQDGPSDQRIAWKIDFGFEFCVNGSPGFAEAKGFKTEVYLLKLKLFRARPLGVLEIYEGDWKRPLLVEVIGDVPPIGLCGSGLLDIVAQLRLVGLLGVNVPGFPVPKMRARVASENHPSSQPPRRSFSRAFMPASTSWRSAVLVATSE